MTPREKILKALYMYRGTAHEQEMIDAEIEAVLSYERNKAVAFQRIADNAFPEPSLRLDCFLFGGITGGAITFVTLYLQGALWK